MEYVTESVGNSSIPLKKALQESLEKASASDRKIMQETLNTLHIEYTPEEENVEKLLLLIIKKLLTKTLQSILPKQIC